MDLTLFGQMTQFSMKPLKKFTIKNGISIFPIDFQKAKRYNPSPLEESILKQFIVKYFNLPERSTDRNTISRLAHNDLVKISPHWTVRNPRLWFNNNKQIQFFKKNDTDYTNIENSDKPSEKQLQISESFSLSITENANKQLNNEKIVENIDFNFSILSNSNNLQQDSMNEKRSIRQSNQKDIQKKCELMRLKKQEKSGTFSENSIQKNTVPTHQEYVSDIIFKDLNKNKERFQNGRRYSEEMIIHFLLNIDQIHITIIAIFFLLRVLKL